MPQVTPIGQPSFQMPQPQGMEQLAPVTPDMVQGSGGNFGELLARLQYLVACLLQKLVTLLFTPGCCKEDSLLLGDPHAASQDALMSQACGALRHQQ